MSWYPREKENFGGFVGQKVKRMRSRTTQSRGLGTNKRIILVCSIQFVLGETLNNRYQIEHKLGHGGSSTVWIAYDLLEKRNVALKVIAAGQLGEDEYNAQKDILQSVQDASHLITFLDTFHLHRDNPDEFDRVLVFPLQGQCLTDIHIMRITMATRMSAARQLLETLKTLHDAGFVHRG